MFLSDIVPCYTVYVKIWGLSRSSVTKFESECFHAARPIFAMIVNLLSLSHHLLSTVYHPLSQLEHGDDQPKDMLERYTRLGFEFRNDACGCWNRFGGMACRTVDKTFFRLIHH